MMRIRAYDSETDDGETRWAACAEESDGSGGWIVVVDTIAEEPTRAAAIHALGCILWARRRRYEDAVRAWCALMDREDPWREWRALGRRLLSMFGMRS